jgi:hypothetical protein
MAVKFNKNSISPTQEFVEKAKEEHPVTDADGRLIIIRKPSFVDEYRYVAALGGQLADNKTFYIMCYPLLWVKSIDGLPFPTITKESQIYAGLERLGREGMEAVNEGINLHFGDDGRSETEAKERIKK